MDSKKNRWMYLVLGLMLFSLIIFSGLPFVSSIAQENPTSSQVSQEKIVSISEQEKARLEAEAIGYEKNFSPRA